MSVEAVREYLKKWGKDQAVREFSQSSATVELAAQAVGVIPARIAKTLSFLEKDGERGPSSGGGGRRQDRQSQIQAYLRLQGENAFSRSGGGAYGTRRGRRLPLRQSPGENRRLSRRIPETLFHSLSRGGKRQLGRRDDLRGAVFLLRGEGLGGRLQGLAGESGRMTNICGLRRYNCR